MQRKEIKRGDLFYYDFGTREGLSKVASDRY